MQKKVRALVEGLLLYPGNLFNCVPGGAGMWPRAQTTRVFVRFQ